MKKIITTILAITAMAGSLWAASASKTFTTHTQAGGVVYLANGESIDYSITGTFVATVRVEKSFDGTNYSLAAGPFTATGTGTIINETGKGAAYRFYCSTHTSGSVVTSLTDVRDVVQIFKNKRNLPILTLKDDVVEVTGDLTVSQTLDIAGGTDLGSVTMTTLTVTGNAFSVGASTLAVGNGIVVAGSTITATVNEADRLLARRVGGTTIIAAESYNNTPAKSPRFIHRRSNGGFGAPIALASGDNIGQVQWAGHDGTAFGDVASISVSAAEAFTTGAHGSVIRISNVSNGSTALTERITVSNDGNVGIGNSAPTARLHVAGTSHVTGASTFVSSVTVTNTDFSVGTSTLVVTNGSVGINNSAPSATLHVTGTSHVTGASTFLSSSTVAADLGVTGVLRPSGSVHVTGASTFTSSMTATGDLGVTGVLRPSGSTHISGASTFVSSVTVTNTNFSVGTSTLVVTNGRVGIGTTNPSGPFHLLTAGNTYLAIGSSGANTLDRGIEFHNQAGNPSGYINFIPNTAGTDSEMQFYVGGGAGGDVKMIINDDGSTEMDGPVVISSSASGAFPIVQNGIYAETTVKAHVKFAGSNGSSIYSVNVTSVTRLGTGNYRLNLGTPMSGINYMTSCHCDNGGSTCNQTDGTAAAYPETSCFNSSAAALDCNRVWCSVLGAQ